jgi:hypothetical protein
VERLEHLRYLRLFGKKSRGVPTLGDRLFSGAKEDFLREKRCCAREWTLIELCGRPRTRV